MDGSSDRSVLTGRNSLLRGLALASAGLAGIFEVISLHATLSGLRPMGAYQGFALFLGLGLACSALVDSAAARRRVFATAALVMCAVAIVGALVIPSRVAEAQGALPPFIPVGQTLLLLLFQTGWAAKFWLTVEGRSTEKGRQIPAALGTVLLIGGGFLLGRADVTAPSDTPQELTVIYDRFPTDEELAFATESEVAGERSGGEFAHYHPGNQPLLGLSFSTREWFGRNRIAGDLTAIFDRESESEGAHLLMAPNGFVVAGVEVQADENVNALRVQFAPFDGSIVSPFDRYWTEWYGGHERMNGGVRLDGATLPIVGVRGSAGLVLSSLSLLVAK